MAICIVNLLGQSGIHPLGAWERDIVRIQEIDTWDIDVVGIESLGGIEARDRDGESFLLPIHFDTYHIRLIDSDILKLFCPHPPHSRVMTFISFFTRVIS